MFPMCTYKYCMFFAALMIVYSGAERASKIFKSYQAFHFLELERLKTWNLCCPKHVTYPFPKQFGYVYTGSDMFRSLWDWIHSGTDPLCLHGTGSRLERYGST